MTVSVLLAGWACIFASAAQGLRFVMLKPEASAWPDTHPAVRAAIFVLAAACTFVGLQILGGSMAVNHVLAGFLVVHAAYSMILAFNLFRQRHLTWLELGGLFRHREPTSAAG